MALRAGDVVSRSFLGTLLDALFEIALRYEYHVKESSHFEFTDRSKFTFVLT